MFVKGGIRKQNFIFLYTPTQEIQFMIYSTDTVDIIVKDIITEFTVENINFLNILIKALMGKRFKSIL